MGRAASHAVTPPAPASVVIGRAPFSSIGAQWVVARAEAELLDRYGSLHPDELTLSATEFDPPSGVFLVARPASQPGHAIGPRQPEAVALYASLGWAREDRDWSGSPLQCGVYRFAEDLV